MPYFFLFAQAHFSQVLCQTKKLEKGMKTKIAEMKKRAVYE
jgi:hypothetical protein